MPGVECSFTTTNSLSFRVRSVLHTVRQRTHPPLRRRPLLHHPLALRPVPTRPSHRLTLMTELWSRMPDMQLATARNVRVDPPMCAAATAASMCQMRSRQLLQVLHTAQTHLALALGRECGLDFPSPQPQRRLLLLFRHIIAERRLVNLGRQFLLRHGMAFQLPMSSD